MRSSVYFLVRLIFAFLTAVLCHAQITIVPTTTLAVETGNNTSAASGFLSQNDGNAAAGNVSKVSVRTLLYPGSNTRIYAHLQPWFGQPKHISVGYNSDDPAQVKRQVSDMLSRGLQGAVLDWYGPNSTRSNQTALYLKTEAETRQGAFEFAIQEDNGALASAARQSGCDVTQQIISDLIYAANTFEFSPAYMRIGGRPVVFFFDVNKYYVDWNKVRASVPLNPLFISRNRSSFAATQSDGAFNWLSVNRSNPYDVGLSYLDDFYTAALGSPTQFAVGSVYKGFNDSLASWGINRFIHQQCGQTWLAGFAEIGRFYSSSNQLDAVQVVTWNDYEEGTEIETGIDNCLSVEPTVSGQTLSWTIPPNPRAAQRYGALQVDETTVDHYTVFISRDGQNLMSLASLPAGTHALDLSQYGLNAGSYTLYVEAVGKPSIQNKMSPPVGFNPVDAPPVAVLSVSPASGVAPLAVTASTSGSSDSDGSITSSRIDFGDGTVVSGPTATHTFPTPGPYTVLATATDNAGLTANATTVVTVAALPQAGVLISSPASGGSVSSDVQVVADAVSPQPVSSFAVLLDGQTIYQIAAPHIDTTLKLPSGSHVLQMQASDSANGTVSSSVSVMVQGTITAPVAALQLSAPAGAPPDTVLACTAASTGFLSSSSVDFGDGTVLKGIAALHTYGDSQPHPVTATITDVDGLTSTATATAQGTGPDFDFGISPANVSVHAGQQAVINLSVSSSQGAFNNAVALACSSGLPAGATCTFSPPSITPGSAGATSTLTISTKAASALLFPPGLRRISPLYSLWFGLPGLIIAGATRRRVRPNVNKVWFLAYVLILIAAHLSCGGGSSSSGTTPNQSPQIGNYTISVSATSGAVQHSIPVALTIN